MPTPGNAGENQNDAGTPPGNAGDNGQNGQNGQNGTPPGNTSGEKPDVQAAINAVVARERARADAALAALRAELETLKASTPAPKKPDETDAAFRAKVEEARKPLEEQITKLTDRLTRLDETSISTELELAAKDAVDPKFVASMLRQKVKRAEDGSFEVVDKDGKPEYGAKGLKTLAELVAETLADKPFLAKSTARNGVNIGKTKKDNATGSDLDAQIAEAEIAKDFVLASRLKAQKLRAMRAF